MASFVLLSLLVGSGVGCSRAVNSGSESWTATPARLPREVITREEILGHPQFITGYEVVARLRPEFLAIAASRTLAGGLLQPVVYVDDVRAGDMSVLRQIHARMIAEVRYVAASEAQTYDGELSAGGRIMVYTQRSPSDRWPRR